MVSGLKRRRTLFEAAIATRRSHTSRRAPNHTLPTVSGRSTAAGWLTAISRVSANPAAARNRSTPCAGCSRCSNDIECCWLSSGESPKYHLRKRESSFWRSLPEGA